MNIFYSQKQSYPSASDAAIIPETPGYAPADAPCAFGDKKLKLRQADSSIPSAKDGVP